MCCDIPCKNKQIWPVMIVIIHNLNMRGQGLRLEDCKFLGNLGKVCLKIRAY